MSSTRRLASCSILCFTLSLGVGCGDSAGDEEATAGAGGSSTEAGGAAGSGVGGTAGTSSAGSAGASATLDCTAPTTAAAKATCAADAFSATLDETQKGNLVYAYTDAAAKTRWSNLPGASRNGLRLGDLSAAQRSAALAVPRAILTDAGYSDLVGVLAADDYLGAQSSSGGGMGGPPGGGAGQYASDNYYLAFIGTPSATQPWMLQFGGHHLAYNIDFHGGVAYPTPNHAGAEPKSSFTINGETYAPLTDEGNTLFAPFLALDAAQLANAYLAGQTFADVLIGPVEYEKGTYATSSFPAEGNRKGLLVSGLTEMQKAFVTEAIATWVEDYDETIAADLMAAYTSADAYADTYIAWGGTQAKGVDPDTNGTYLRIDGPRVWIELSCQNGVVIQNATHFHTIFRDKLQDYGGSL